MMEYYSPWKKDDSETRYHVGEPRGAVAHGGSRSQKDKRTMTPLACGAASKQMHKERNGLEMTRAEREGGVGSEC